MPTWSAPKVLETKLGVGLAIGAVTVLHATFVCANEAIPVRLFFDAPAVCPSEEDFVRGVQLRTRAVKWAADANATVGVSIEPSAQGFDGRVDVSRPPDRWSRMLVAASCSDLVDAAGLVVAMAFDAHAQTSADQALRPQEQPQSDAVDTPPQAIAPDSEPRRAWLAGAGVRWRGALGPSLRPQYAAFVETRRNAPGWFEPSIRLSGYYANSGTLQTSAGSATLDYGGGGLHACSSQVRIGSLVWRGLCAGVELGAVVATSQIDLPRSQTRLWFGVEAGSSLAWCTKRLCADVSAMVGSIPQGYSFRFTSPMVPIHEVHGVYGAVGAEVAWQFL